MAAPYQCSLRLKYSNDFVGYPRVVARGQYEAIVCDWTGTLSHLDLAGKTIVKRENVAWVFEGQPLACTNLSSLQVQPETVHSCVVATRGAYAALWDLESSEVLKIHPDTGPVNAVAYSPNGARLAIGTGFYNLSPGQIVRPAIQVWALSGTEPICLMSTVLPGVCVDAILWDSDCNRIVCVTGDESQVFGYFCCLDGNSLRSHSLDRIPLAAVSRILATEHSYLVAHRGGIQAFDRNDFSKQWTHAEPVEAADLAFDEWTELLFFSGTTFLTMYGEVVGSAKSIDTLTSIAPRPDGGFLGVSNQGIISAWDCVEADE